MSTKEKERKRFYCPAGEQYADDHAIVIDDFGHKELKKTGTKTNIYEIIQSHADECDIEQLLERAKAEGMEILDRREAIYGDMTNVPKSLLEATQILQNMENNFNELPLEIREKFNFNFNEYIAEGSNNFDSWMTKMGYQEPKDENSPTQTEPVPEKGGDE